MRSLNRLNQFSRLWQLTDGQPGLTTVSELATHCYCSERHMRTLLNQFSANGWLSWQAHSGRGKRGLLTFLTTPHAQRTLLLEQALTSGAHDDALALAALDPEQLRQTLTPLLGGRWVNAHSTLRIPYYRPLEPLRPGFQAGRAEQHLANQVLSGLTRFNDHSAEPQPDMAHHWQVTDSGLTWLFFVRPTLHWHDGSRVNAADLVTRLRQLIALPALAAQFATVAAIDSPADHCLRIRLHSADYWLPYRLASHCCRLAHPQRDDCGCGPFRLVSQSAERLRLECHEHYHLEQPLLNAVEYWITPSLFDSQTGTSCRHPVQLAVGQQAQWVELRPVSQSLSLGFCYLAIRPDGPLSQEQARGIMGLIQHQGMVAGLPLEASLISPSSAMLPGWAIPDYPCQPALKLPPVLRLAYHLPMELEAMAQRLKQRLAALGCELRLQFHNAKSWEDAAQLADADLVMGDRLIGESPVWTLEQWLRCDPMWQALLADDHQQRLRGTLDRLQAEPEFPLRERALREVMLDLMAQGVIMPLFHYHYQISAPPGVNGITLNARGWFDFSRAWLPPPQAVCGSDIVNAGVSPV